MHIRQIASIYIKQKIKMDLNQILELRNSKLTEMEDIISTGKIENRKLSSVEAKVFNDLKEEVFLLDEQIKQKNEGLEKTNKRNTNKTMEKFSLLKAIEARANGRQLDEVSLSVVEAGREEMRKSGQAFTGDIQLPVELRAITAGTATAGQEVVAEDKIGLIEPLRESLVLVKAGATFLTGLVGDVSIPVYTGSNATWKGETAAADNGQGTFSEVTLSPKRLTTFIDISKQFLNQDSVQAEEMLMRDIVNAISLKLEGTILGKAAGSATQPAGFFATNPTINGVASYANIVAMETSVDTNNALIGNCAYITNAGGRGKLKTTPKVAGQPIFILGENGEMNGYPVLVTNSVASGLQTGLDEFGVVFGNWGQFIIGQWGALDLIVDPLSQATNGNVRIVINAYFDAKPRIANAFKTASVK